MSGRSPRHSSARGRDRGGADGGAQESTSWTLPPLKADKKPRRRKGKFARSPKRGGDGGLDSDRSRRDDRDGDGESPSPTRSPKSRVGKRRTTSPTRKHQSPQSDRRTSPRRTSSAAPRLGYRASGGRVQLVVQQPFFKRKRTKLEKKRLKQRKRALQARRRQHKAAVSIQQLARGKQARDNLQWRKEHKDEVLQQQEETRERREREEEEARARRQREQEEARLRREREKARRAREEQQAAINIQRAARGRSARRRYQEHIEVTEAARAAQAAAERKARYDDEQRQQEQEAAAARRVQSVARGRLARKRVAVVRANFEDKQAQHAAAQKVQAIVRGRQGRAKAQQKACEHKAATKINSLGRAFFARRRVERVKEEAAGTASESDEDEGAAEPDAAAAEAESAPDADDEADTTDGADAEDGADATESESAPEKPQPHDLSALSRAIERARENFDHEALRAFIDKTLTKGVDATNDVVVEAEELYTALIEQREAVLKIQRIVRGKLARLDLQTLKLQIEAAVMLQSFMRLKLSSTKMASQLQMNEETAVGRLQRAIRGMISRKIYAEGMSVLNAKMDEAMQKLHVMLDGVDGTALVRQNLLITNAAAVPGEVSAAAGCVRCPNTTSNFLFNFVLQAGRSHAISGLAKTVDLTVTRESASSRLGGGFDKLVGMASSTFKGLLSRLVISKISPGTPMALADFHLDDIVLSIDGEDVESVQDLVGAVNGKTKVVCLRVVSMCVHGVERNLPPMWIGFDRGSTQMCAFLDRVSNRPCFARAHGARDCLQQRVVGVQFPQALRAQDHQSPKEAVGSGTIWARSHSASLPTGRGKKGRHHC